MNRTTLISGLPSSGNHYVQQLLANAGWASPVCHGIETSFDDRVRNMRGKGVNTMIIPVRDPLCSKASCEYGRVRHWPEKNLSALPFDREYRQNATRNVLRAAIEHEYDVLMLSYEALCANPEPVLRDTLEWLGETPEEAASRAAASARKLPAVEGNEKYYREWERADAAV